MSQPEVVMARGRSTTADTAAGNRSDSAESEAGEDSLAWSAEHGAALRQLRIRRGMLQQELATAVGQPRTVVSNWETGVRAPSPARRAAIAAALHVEPHELATLAGQAEEPAAAGPWSIFRDMIDEYLDEDGGRRVDRFTAQVELFGRLSPAELTVARWPRLHSVAASCRQDLSALMAGQSGSWRTAAVASGVQLARTIRVQAGLSRAPLPELAATAERCGVQLFRVPLPAGTAGRIRAAAVIHPPLGVAAMVNSMLAPQHRLVTYATAFGQLLLQEQPTAVKVVSAAREHIRRAIMSSAANAFAVEFALPSEAAARAAILTSTLHPHPASASPHDWIPTIADLVHTFRVPVAVAISQISRSPDLNRTQRDQLHTLLRNSEVLAAEVTADRRPDDAEPSLDDLPPRLANLLLLAVAGDRISLGSAAQITGVDPGEFEQALARAEAQRCSDDDEGWIDDWDPRVA
jgi:transcriptional regulator with XRE-family HTH domain